MQWYFDLFKNFHKSSSLLCKITSDTVLPLTVFLETTVCLRAVSKLLVIDLVKMSPHKDSERYHTDSVLIILL